MDSTGQTLSLDEANEELTLLREENRRLRERLQNSTVGVSEDEKLAESETRYRNFIDSSHDLIQSVKPDGSFDFVNKTWLERLGYEEFEVKKMNFTDIIHESSMAHCMTMFEQIMSGQDVENVKATFKTKSGEKLEVSGEIRIRVVNGKVTATHGIFQDLTDQYELTDQFEEWNEILGTMYRQASVGIVLCDLNSTILKVNSCFANTVKYSPEEMVGMTFNQFKSEEALNKLAPDLMALIEGRKDHVLIDGTCKRSDDTLATTLIEVFPIKKQGKTTSLFAVVNDLDALNMKQEELIEKNRLLASIMESTHEMYWEIDRDFVYTWVSPRISEIYGFAPEEIIGTRGEKLFDKDHFEEHMADYRELRENPYSYRDALLTCRNKGGERIYVRCSGFPYFDEDGEFAGLRGSHVNDTESQASAERTAVSELRFREIVEQSTSWFWESDAEGKITYVTQNVKHLTGYDAEEIIGSVPTKFLPYDPSRPHDLSHRLLLRDEPFKDLLFILEDRNGNRRIFASSGTPRYCSSGKFKGFRGNDRDVTEKITAIERLSASESWLRKSQEISNTGSWRMHPITKEVQWSTGVFNILEIEAHSIKPDHSTLLAYIKEEYRHKVAPRLDHIVRLKPLKDIEFEITTAKGKTKYVRSHVEDGLDELGFAFGILQDITVDRQRQAAVMESEERFRNIVESSNTYFWEIGVDKKFTYVSNNIEDILGYSSREMIGQHLEKMVGESEVLRTDEMLCSVIGERKDVKGYSTVAFHKNGSQVRLVLNAMPLYGNDGQIQSVRGSCTDISEYLRLSQKVDEVDQLQDVLFRQDNIGVGMLDLDGTWLQVNDALVEMLGYSAEELLSLTFLDITAPEFVAVGKENIKQVNQNEVPHVSLVKQYIRKDGSLIWCQVDSFSIYNADGEPQYMYALIKDINTEIKAQEQIKRNEIFLKLSQEIAKTGSWRFDLNKGELEWSDGYFRMFGYNPEETEADLDIFWKHIHPDDIEMVQDSFSRFMEKGDLDNREFRIIDRSGNVKNVLSYSLPTSPAGESGEFMGALLDISSIREKDRELHKTLKDLKISNEELEQFAYVASHDLQEPIRLINTYASMLNEKLEGKLDDSGALYMKFIQDSSTRMRDLVQGLLEFSLVGHHQMKFEQVDVNELIQPIVLNFTKEMNQYGTELIVEDLPVVDCDKLQVSRLFQNLIGNAVKFSRNSTNPEIIVSAKSNNDFHTITIQDNGIGIKQENLDKIFTIFKRLNNREQYEGHGLGMSISKKIADMHGGKLVVDSVFGEGSSVSFTLPKKA